eukprot:scaffold4079_cov392-Prasinococcus_capsulatus_cf.AAC.5
MVACATGHRPYGWERNHPSWLVVHLTPRSSALAVRPPAELPSAGSCLTREAGRKRKACAPAAPRAERPGARKGDGVGAPQSVAPRGASGCQATRAAVAVTGAVCSRPVVVAHTASGIGRPQTAVRMA